MMNTELERRTEVLQALDSAEEMRQSGNYEEAITLLSNTLQQGIDIAHIYYRLGNVYYDAKKYEHAEYSFRRAIDNDQLHVNAHYNLGVVYRKMGRIDESMKMRRKANKIARQHPEKLKVSQEQIKQVRSVAKGMIFFGLGFIAVLILVLYLILN